MYLFFNFLFQGENALYLFMIYDGLTDGDDSFFIFTILVMNMISFWQVASNQSSKNNSKNNFLFLSSTYFLSTLLSTSFLWALSFTKYWSTPLSIPLSLPLPLPTPSVASWSSISHRRLYFPKPAIRLQGEEAFPSHRPRRRLGRRLLRSQEGGPGFASSDLTKGGGG